MSARVDPAGEAHLDAWTAMRAALWPDDAAEVHRREAAAMLATDGLAAFVALDGGGDGEAIAFAEASIRRDYVNGCDTSPIAFVDGLYVVPGHRRRGIARALVAAIADWGRAAGCAELASDAPLDNLASHRFHAAAGFAETERVVYFRRML